MVDALGVIEKLAASAPRWPASPGHREYNPGWHTALDLRHLLTVSEAIARCGDRAQGEPRRPLPRGFPGEGPRSSARSTWWCSKRPDGSMELRRIPIPEMPAELKQVIEENKSTSNGQLPASNGQLTQLPNKSDVPGLAGRRDRGAVQGLHRPKSSGDGRPRCDAPDPGVPGGRPRLPLELQGRQVRLLLRGDQRQAAADVHDPAERARRSTSRSPSSR